MDSKKFSNWYDKNYKKILIIPIILVLLSLSYMVYFYINNNSFFYMDVSLTGGTSYTIISDYDVKLLEQNLSSEFTDFSIKSVSDGSGKQLQIIVMVPEEESDLMKDKLEEALGFELNEDNTYTEYTSSGLSSTFLKQIYVAVLLSFFWMGAVVFIIFGKGGKIKFWAIFINLLFAVFLGNFFYELKPIVSAIIFFVFFGILLYIYIKNSIPSFAVIFSAFSNILMTLVVVDLFGLRLSSAGIVSFLMLIGYSVDTDTMLTTRLINRKDGDNTNSIIWGAFKTGFAMSFTSLIAVAAGLAVVYSYASVLNQIFTILLIGLFFDLMNTWITNVIILKWFSEKKQIRGNKK